MARADERPGRARLVPPPRHRGLGGGGPCEGIICPGGRAGELVRGVRISFSLSCLKKKKVQNLHHDFLTNVGEGGLPAWSCLIWSLRSRTNVCALGAAPLLFPAHPHAQRDWGRPVLWKK